MLFSLSLTITNICVEQKNCKMVLLSIEKCKKSDIIVSKEYSFIKLV